MPELRWILIAAGLVLLLGLWLWGSRRRSRQASEQAEAQVEADRRSEPTLGDASPPPPASRPEELPPIRASRRERSTGAAELPVVEIPGNAEPELAPRATKPDVAIHVPYRSMRESLTETGEEARGVARAGAGGEDEHEPWIRTQPIERDNMMTAVDQQPEAPAAETPAEAPAAGAPAGGEQHAASDRQKIVALRLVATDDRWPGDAVIQALEAEGLRFGKYSIFHRERDDGKSIFYVASMIEPGSFDLETMDSVSFPGISIFSVLPGPVDAGTTFDLMLATARRLAERLPGHLQDEHGSTLTAQRILNLREELVHFEHMMRRVRSR